ncbi:MAG: SsrA-binding protein SmpB [Candidatus Absconditabacterales bacterium]
MKSITKNRHAYHDYAIDKEYDVGIILKGHEVKSIKASHVNIKDSIIRIDNRELRIIGMDIPLYEKTSHVLVPGYQPKGKRKLLITKKELTKISAQLDKSGTIAIPLEVFVTKTGFIKLKIGIGKLMRKVDKKQVLKERDIKKQMDREMKHL